MKYFVEPGGGCAVDVDPEGPARNGAALLHPYPAGKLERERAVLDLADAAQAATRAAILHERGEDAESRRLARLAQHLYDQADTHRLHADQAHRTQRDRGNAIMATHDEAPPTRHPQEPGREPDPPASDDRVRGLVNELARIQDQLAAEDRATGARPSPGSTRRRAALLRRERDVIRQLRANTTRPDAAPERSPDMREHEL